MHGIFLSFDSIEVIKPVRLQISFGDYVAQWMHVFGRQQFVDYGLLSIFNGFGNSF
jgi:hypothetical protein